MNEVVGIRDILEDAPDDGLLHTEQDSLEEASDQSFDILIFGASSCTVNPGILNHPLRPTIEALLDIYIQRVDLVFKLIHVPSLCTAMLSLDRHSSSEIPSPPALSALRFAVYFSAVCTLSEEDCRNTFANEKTSLVHRFRIATEVMLSQANLLVTSDITVLQAFAIYLVSY